MKYTRSVHTGSRLENGETVKLIDLPAQETADALGRKCQHPGPSVYTAVIGAPTTLGGEETIGRIYWGGDLVWKTGAEQVAEYCRQKYQEWKEYVERA